MRSLYPVITFTYPVRSRSSSASPVSTRRGRPCRAWIFADVLTTRLGKDVHPACGASARGVPGGADPTGSLKTPQRPVDDAAVKPGMGNGQAFRFLRDLVAMGFTHSCNGKQDDRLREAVEIPHLARAGTLALLPIPVAASSWHRF